MNLQAGQITSPRDGSNMTVLPGSTVNITWSFNDDVSKVISRVWSFTSSDGSIVNKLLAIIIFDGRPQIEDSSGLSGVSIVKPATLLLKNVNQTYDGTYWFDLSASGSGGSSQVVVIIARKPTATINCSSPITVDEDDDLICLCKGGNGNPPADVVWYDKNDNAIGQKKKEQKSLVLRNVAEADSGPYTCKAQSYNLIDEKSIEVKVSLNYKPTRTDIQLSRTSRSIMFGQQVTITCTSNGQPDTSFTIIHNGTINVAVVGNTYTKQVNWSDAGNYTCVAFNKLGSNSSDTKFLNVTVKETPQAITTTIPFTSTEENGTGKASSVHTSCSTEWYIIVVTLMSGFFAGILVSYIAWCFHRRWFRNRKPKRNPDQQPTEADSTYQELDMSKINTEDNYQSLRGNVARINDVTNDDESNYTELSKTRDVEDNYQSLS